MEVMKGMIYFYSDPTFVDDPLSLRKKTKEMTHKDLKVWQNSIDLVVSVYKLTQSFPTQELYGLTSHIRKTAISIPSNISEGAGRDHTKDYIRFLYISLGSLAELETQALISNKLRYTSKEEFNEIEKKIIGIRIQLAHLIKVLKKKLENQKP